MSNKLKLSDHIEKKPQTRLVQAFIEIKLLENVRVILKKNKVKIKSLIEAAFKQYIEENKDVNDGRKN